METQFIPFLLKRFNYQLPKNRDELAELYDAFAATPFFIDMKEMEGTTLEKETFLQNADPSSWETLLGYILKFYGPKGLTAKIYGDKTPQYLYRIKMLKEAIPNAKFVHIIRDPRDYCISVRNIWGKHIYRAAENWRCEIKKARHDVKDFKEDYLEIRYETLIMNPETTMDQICKFTGIQFTEQMTTLAKPSENYGSAKGKTTIVANNKNKYNQLLSPTQVKRIEEIAFDVMQSTNYKTEYAHTYQPLHPIQQKYFKVYDGIASAHFHIRERGLIKGVAFFLSFHKLTSS